MPEIRERDPNAFIKATGKGKHRGKKDSIAPRIDNAVRDKVREHRNRKEESNEYAVGITEETAVEVAIEARRIPGDIKRTIDHLQTKTKGRVLNEPEPEELELEDPGQAPDPIEQQHRELAAKKAQETTDTPPLEEPQHSADSYTDYSLHQYDIENPQYISEYDPDPSVESPQGSTPSSAKYDIKEKPKGNTAPKQRPEQEPKTRSRTEQASHKTNRPAKHAQNTQQSAAKKATEQGRKKFKREAQKQAAKNAKKATKKTAETAKKAGEAVVRATKSVIEIIVAAIGGVGLVAILAVIVVIGAIMASPLGILFSVQPAPETVSLSTAVSQIDQEFAKRLHSLQDGECDSTVIHGSPPDWVEVVAVFACYTSETERGLSASNLTTDQVTQLRSVYWDMCLLPFSIETIEHPDSDPEDNVDDSWTETVLHIWISAKSAEEMRTIYAFSGFQNEALSILLSDRNALKSLLGK